MPAPRLRVLTRNAALGPLDYRAPAEGVPVGSVVRVPLGPRELHGVVWDADRLPTTEVADAKLRPIHGVAPVLPIPASVRRLVEWVAAYYLVPPAAVLRMVMSVSAALDGARTVTEYRVSGQLPERMTEKREAALTTLGDAQGLVRELAEWSGVSDAVIRGLISAGAIEPVTVSVDRAPPLPDPGFGPPVLEAEQEAAASALVAAVKAHDFAPFLLDGVTGSGKTETYLEAVAAALDAGGQALVLLPEIALTEPFLRRFEARFGCKPVQWHSDLRSSERRAAWRAAASGAAKVVVGARSALFLPYPDLRLIVVDEAHETSFKQEDGVPYHARDVAVMRAQIEAIPIVLATATPAIETLAQVTRGRYRHLELPSRFGGAQMPEIEAIDLRVTPPEQGRWLAPPLVEAMKTTLARGEQALLFLNRRGYAPLTLCRHCGTRIECPNCTAWMVEHRLVKRLQCHHCGLVEAVPDACPECGEEHSLVACGPGVERIAEEVSALFPDANVALVTSDTIHSPAQAKALVDSALAGEIDIFIGTQLITKGYHFPELTLVGVVDADLALKGGDLRAGERSFQQISQVAGRAGRGQKPGHVYIQTHQPEAPVLAALVAGDAPGFYAAETEARRAAAMPPFGRLAAIIVSGPDEAEVAATARAIGRAAPTGIDGLTILGPAPAPLSLLRGRFRHRLLVHAARRADVQGLIADWLGGVEVPRNVRVAVDIDPYSFV
ncbi:primosomal protein N' [Sphingosinicella sp.]|uniref:primosomal protein N' n=1 Tax=Sphingosinicella sp. TaxID=1917971 RepID=UPI0017F9490E|nr:primosomal protein N' [Sphingosinicella sp.]MBA4759820.1 primosomal protein N' [Sphingosinicella sp.]